MHRCWHFAALLVSSSLPLHRPAAAEESRLSVQLAIESPKNGARLPVSGNSANVPLSIQVAVSPASFVKLLPRFGLFLCITVNKRKIGCRRLENSSNLKLERVAVGAHELGAWLADSA